MPSFFFTSSNETLPIDAQQQRAVERSDASERTSSPKRAAQTQPPAGEEAVDWYETTEAPPPYGSGGSTSLIRAPGGVSAQGITPAPDIATFFRRSVTHVFDGSRALFGQKTSAQLEKKAEAKEYLAEGNQAQSWRDHRTALSAYRTAYALLQAHQLDAWPVFFGDGVGLQKDHALNHALTGEDNASIVLFLLHIYDVTLAKRSNDQPLASHYEALGYQKLTFLHDDWLKRHGRLARAALLEGKDELLDRVLSELQDVQQATLLPSSLQSQYARTAVLDYLDQPSVVLQVADDKGCKKSLLRMATLQPTAFERTVFLRLHEQFRQAMATASNDELLAHKQEVMQFAEHIAKGQKATLLPAVPLKLAEDTPGLVQQLFARSQPVGESRAASEQRWATHRPFSEKRSEPVPPWKAHRPQSRRLVRAYELTPQEMRQPQWLQWALFAGLKPRQVAVRADRQMPHGIRVVIADRETQGQGGWHWAVFNDAEAPLSALMPLVLLSESESTLGQFGRAWPTDKPPPQVDVEGLQLALTHPSTQRQAVSFLDKYSKETRQGAMGLTPIYLDEHARAALPPSLQRWLINGRRDNEVLFNEDAPFFKA